MHKLTLIAFMILSGSAAILAQVPQTIAPGFTIERIIGIEETHSFELTAGKGKMVTFRVEQRGVDVVLRLYAPGGRFLDRVDTPNGNEGEEVLNFVANADGPYRIDLARWWGDRNIAGKYFLKTVDMRKATRAEIKAARLKEELLRLVEEEVTYETADAFKRLYAETAILTDPYGSQLSVNDVYDFLSKNPRRQPEKTTIEIELSGPRLIDLGSVVIMSVDRSRREMNSEKGVDLRFNQRIGYVFQRSGNGWKILSAQRTWSDSERKYAVLDAKAIDSVLGVYGEPGKEETISIVREANSLYGKFTGRERFELIPANENTFHSSWVSIAFIRGIDGTAEKAVIYFPLPENRMSINPRIK